MKRKNSGFGFRKKVESRSTDIVEQENELIMCAVDTKQRHQEALQRRERLGEELGIENPEAVPKLEKIIVNVGVGDAPDNLNRLETVQNHLERITGQQPVVTRAKKSIAGFNIRKGEPAGVKATLRGKRMDDFLKRLIHIALPRTKDFRGLDPASFDGQGNYSLGIDEQSVFPEINFEETEITFGMDVTVVTSVRNDQYARALLEDYGFPIQSE